MALELSPVTMQRDLQPMLAPPPQQQESLGSALSRERWLIIAFIAIFLVLGGILIRTLPLTYTSSMSLAPTVDSPGSGGGGAASALASTLGINQASSNDQEVVLKLLTSYVVAEHLVRERPDLIRALFRGRWSGTEWVMPSGFSAQLKDTISQIVTGQPAITQAEPTPYDIMNSLTKRITIDRNRDSEIVQANFEDSDPVFARDFLSATFAMAQEIIRDRLVRESTARMEYARKTLDTVTIAEHRDLLIRLMSVEQQNLMTLAGRSDLGSRIIDPPSMPTSPSGPKAIVILLAMALLGILCAIVIIGYRVKRRQKAQAARALAAA
ncbi:MAG: hypothetical protein JF625_13735 [Inquilinus limosus]|uniref:Polysaccharide chain length determinant N-terminal domain-containing protein n=1 Tax=Inquilinus limosus TaxID=171674 RepID=A0A952KDM1_9PROT|nr:hypothetical protein [Inquilinus limosus]